MGRKMFVNLPVKDLVGEDAYVMLLTHPKFRDIAPQTIADATKSTEVLVALSCENRGKVDEMVAKAVAGGGRTYSKPKGYGFMYGHGFQDLDGHVWEVFYMDPSAVKPQ